MSQYNSDNSQKPFNHSNTPSQPTQSNASIHSSSSSISSAQSSSLFSQTQASTVPSSAFSARQNKQTQSSNLLRTPDNNEYEPIDPFGNQNQNQPQALIQQSQQLLSSSPVSSSPSSVPLTQHSLPTPFTNTNSNTANNNTINNSSASPIVGRFPPISQQSLSFSASNPSLNPQSPLSHATSQNLFSDDLLNSQSTTQPTQPPSQPTQSTRLSITNVLQRLAENLTSCRTRANNRNGTGILRIALEVDQSMNQALSSSVLQNVPSNTTNTTSNPNPNPNPTSTPPSNSVISVFSEPALVTVIQVCLHFIDNFYSDPSMATRRAHLLNQLYELGVLLKILPNPSSSLASISPLSNYTYSSHSSPSPPPPFPPTSFSSFSPATIPQPRIFALGVESEYFPGMDRLDSVLRLMAHHPSTSTMDQEGSFVTLVLRGLDTAFAVPTYYFGYPKLLPKHRQAMISLSDSFGHDAHFFCAQNYIRAASLSASNMANVSNILNPSSGSHGYASSSSPSSPVSPAPITTTPTADFNGFMAPFRVPKDPLAPPISMSISTDSMTSSVSGTLGGYIYPKVDPSNKHLADYAKSTYGMTCAHVCLAGENLYPRVTIPSTFMVNVFRRLLMKEREKYGVHTYEYGTYSKALDQVHARLFVNESGKKATAATSNSTLTGTEASAPSLAPSPANIFGQVAWGEREVVNGKLSDVAIIKCEEKLKCRNTLGDDIYFSQYDPGLRFGCLDVKSVVHSLTPGMKVFKYGSTTKYTAGRLNGPKIVYWSEGKLQSSEFVVTSGGAFANGGDSGAWILHKNEGNGGEESVGSEEYDSSINESFSFTSNSSSSTATATIYSTNATATATNASGKLGVNNSFTQGPGPSLGVVGMLHSYDGERREFGLFTPMRSILDRLHEVTGTPWGVVGIAEKGDEDLTGPGNSDSSEEEGHDER